MSKTRQTADPADDSDAKDAAMIEAAQREVRAAKLADESDAGATGKDDDSGELGFSVPPPDSFTGYSIVREIHRGGQGVVFQALQEAT